MYGVKEGRKERRLTRRYQRKADKDEDESGKERISPIVNGYLIFDELLQLSDNSRGDSLPPSMS